MEPNEVGILGIWGMGGIGKTTIARVIFNKYSSQYEGCCFLENEREQSQTQRGLDDLRMQLVSQLLVKCPPNAISAKRMLSRKKALIVVDDVDSSTKLKHLIGEQICLGAGSSIIVTTRDKQVLIAARVHHIYKVQELSSESSLELFCLKAFHKRYPETGYEELSKMAISFANGIPLALEVLGSSLCSRSAEAWESELRKLNTHLNPSILDVGKTRNVIRFLDSCDFFGAIGIDNLQRKALITISRYNTIEMHDLIEQMGLEIVFNESTKDVKKRSRLRNPEDVRNLLENSKGEKSVEGIMCDLSQIGDLRLNANSFKNMPHLRFLKLYAPWDRKASIVYVPKTLMFSAKLRYLEWNSYPLNSLPSRFCTEKLVELWMPNSQISKLWEGTQDLPNLTKVYLNGCKQLVELPDFSKATKLEIIFLNGCEKLCQLHPSILSIQSLEYLFLNGCKELKSVKGQLKSLKLLAANNCSLEEFTLSAEELHYLCLSLRGIKSLQNELCCFKSLYYLSFYDCRELTELPHNMKALSRLTSLTVSGCCALRSIPELPPFIQFFKAIDCTSLETIFSLKRVFSLNTRNISFVNCVRLKEESVNDIMEDAHLTIFRNVFLSRATVDVDGHVWHPGDKVPERFFKCRTEEASITIQLEQCEYQLLGFVFCCVVSQNLPHDYFCKLGGVDIKCEYLHLGYSIEHTSYFWPDFNRKRRSLDSDHVLIWTNQDGSSKVLSKMKRYKGSDDDDDSTCKRKMSFRFSVDRPEKGKRVEEREEDDKECYIKGCGVIPVYASTVVDAIQKLELEFNLNAHHDSIPSWMDLDTLKSHMIRKSRGKSKLWW
ncbi:hypothetical protein PIB30_048429 [Stylosanthes scabra]|uniref:TMV resistance protein N-like n=1 Tax=Stylosanthes scabra TaxID=79078 RepID=A0ABU6TGR8_9FABA|nr:hypothetical protein [Stylosanthes scabra]